MMNKILLTKFIREEIKNVREQMSDDLENTTSNDDAYSKAFDSMDTDPTQAIEKMADVRTYDFEPGERNFYPRIIF
jgi:2-hydroxy-3-keto-5-methylthiopentenyl-1-phosphate phosphatase